MKAAYHDLVNENLMPIESYTNHDMTDEEYQRTYKDRQSYYEGYKIE